MVDQSRHQLTHGNRLLVPSRQAAREQVEDDRQIQPAFSRPDVGDVDAPFLIGSLGLERLVEQVWGDGPRVLAVGGALEATLLTGDEIILAHQPGGSTAADRTALTLQLARHARTAIRCRSTV